MAQASSFQQYLTESNYSPTPISRKLAGSSEGVGGLAAGLSRTAELIPAAMDAYKTYQVNDIREKIKADLQPLLEDTLAGSTSYKNDVESSLAMNQETLNILPSVNGPEDPEDLNNFISGIESNINKDLKFLTKARDQSRMTQFEFEQRSLGIARKYLSTNPGLRKEIINTISNTFEDQGIIERIKFDENLVKNQASAYELEVKNIRDNFEKFNIPEGPYRLADGSLDIRSAQNSIDKFRSAKQARDAFMSDIDINKQVTEAELRQVESSGMIPQIVFGQYNEDTATLSNIFTENVDNFPKAKLQAKAFISNQLLAFKSDPRIAKYMGSAVVKDNIASYEKQLQALDTAMESFNSLEDLQKFTQNSKSIMQDQQSMNLMKDLDVPRMELAIKIGSVGNLINSTEGQGYIKELIISTRDIFSSGKLSNSNMFNKVPGTNGSGMSLMLNQALKGSPSEVTSQVLNANIDAINDSKVSPTQVDAFTRTDTFIKDIGKSEYKDKFIDVDPTSVTKTMDLLSKYNEQIDTDLQRYFITNPNKAVKIEINPGTGLLYAQGADTDFNSRYVGRINDSLKAYANVRVQSPKEVWKDFYQEFFPSISQGKTLATKAEVSNNPLNLKDTKGEFRNFNSLEEAVGAYESQLLSYFEGKGVAGGKPRNTIKGIVDLWRPSSDRRGETDVSQENYYKFLSDYMTKAPNTPLDLKDKETMAKLIAGMAKLESGKDLEVNRVSSFLKKSNKSWIEKQRDTAVETRKKFEQERGK